MTAFVRYELRTTNPSAATELYRDVLSIASWPGDLLVSALPESALARGARSHWLGHVGVSDLEGRVERMERAGATRLGPERVVDGLASVALRDPFGAAIAVARGAERVESPSVVWHHLNTPDHDGSLALYRSLFGWALFAPATDRVFSFATGSAPVGSATTIVDPTRTHPHWNFFFPVRSLDTALARVRARGGLNLEPSVTATGARVAACDDAQGAAFGLWQAPA